jgi:hypothetical protein
MFRASWITIRQIFMKCTARIELYYYCGSILAVINIHYDSSLALHLNISLKM